MYVVVMLVQGSSVWFVRSVCSLYGVSLYHFISVLLLFLVLTISNEGAYLTFKSIFHKALNLFQQPVLGNKGKVSCSRKQQGLSWGSNPRPPHYESDVQPTAPRRSLSKSGMGHLIVIANVVMIWACPHFNTILHIVRWLRDNFSVKSRLQFKMFHQWTAVTSYSQGSVRRLMDHN